MRVAILKPDHVGDLVLSSAAIRAISAGVEAKLFVQPSNLRLAQALFPGVDLGTIGLPHLIKTATVEPHVPDLSDYDVVAVLRNDAVLNPSWARIRTRGFVLPVDDNSVHQSIADYSVASAIVGAYDIDSLHFGERAAAISAKSRAEPALVGLAIGAGFHTNRWPLTHWIDLARGLLEGGVRPRIISGPGEASRTRFVAERAGLDPDRDIVVGGQDFSAFFEQVDALDVVVASDGGAAHLCGLRAPVLSIFGSSPYRRYSPLGVHNRLLSRMLACSPCCQYSTHLLNGCVTVECMSLITPDVVLDCLRDLRLRPTALPGSRLIDDDIHLVWGASHLNRSRVLAESTSDRPPLSAHA